MSQVKKELNKIKEMYESGNNIINKYSHEGLRDAIMVSYDLQAGSYNSYDEDNPEIREKISDTVSYYINGLGDINNILEIGVGEATNFKKILPKLTNHSIHAYGFDISWSRIKYGNHHLGRQSLKGVELFVGDLFNSPILDDSIDVVYTLHSLEPNGGREEEALVELYRIANKYLVLFEPLYELASVKTKKYMDEHGYVKNLYSVAKNLGYNVVEYKLLYEGMYGIFNTRVTIIEKNENRDAEVSSPMACPITRTPIEKIRDNYFSKESLLLYPIIERIPCLLPENAIIATHYLDEFS